MFFFIDYIQKHKDFPFASLTIKYNNLIDYIINCAELCRSPFEKFVNPAKKRGVRIQRQNCENFLNYQSQNYLSKEAKINLNIPDEVNVTATTNSNSNDGGKRKKKQGIPTEMVTMDFIYFISFFNQKFPSFMDSIIVFFIESIKKKRKKDLEKFIEACRSFVFFCIQVTRIQIIAIEFGGVENSADLIDQLYSKLEGYLNQIINVARDLMKSSIAAIFDFFISQVNELINKLNLGKISDFSPNEEKISDDERMLSFLIDFITGITANDYLTESINSPHVAEFYAVGFLRMNEESVTIIFDTISSSLSQIEEPESDKKPLLQKLWLIMRKRPELRETLKEMFEASNYIQYDGSEELVQLIKRDDLSNWGLEGLANLLFGKLDNMEEEDIIDPLKDDEIFQPYVENDDENNEEYEYDDCLKQTFDLNEDDEDDDLDNDDHDHYGKRQLRSCFGLDDKAIIAN